MNDSVTKGTADPARRRVAHEIRNSLGAVRTATELLERHYRPEGREQRLFQVILKEIVRLGDLVTDELAPSDKPPPPSS